MGDPSAAGSRPSLFERLLAESREAHACGQHQVAYHALTAAMHAADAAADVPALETAGHEATAQLAHIDVHVPEHRLSTRSAARHAHPGVYTLLARQSQMHVQMHEAREEARERSSASRTRDHGAKHAHDVV